MNLLLARIEETAMAPAFALLPQNMNTPKARVQMLATGLQESRFEHRYQVVSGGGKGPARGFWQFERGTKASRGGVWGVYLHPASNEHLRLLCRARDVSFDPTPIWEQLEHDDVLAAGVARLLYWTNPKPLPDLGDAQGAWDYYESTWLPGKPHRHTWNAFYTDALHLVQPEAADA